MRDEKAHISARWTVKIVELGQGLELAAPWFLRYSLVRRFLFALLTVFCVIAASSARLYAQEDSLHVIEVVRLDHGFDKLVPLNVKIEKIAAAGNVFGARPGSVNIFAPDGTLLGAIEIGAPTSNLAWGDDGSTLYITAGTALYRIKLTSKGVGF